MVKLRQAGYCNLKLLLLYLVVYGHWIETGIGGSDILLVQYRIIYLIHMPLFAFLSGLFLRSSEDCTRQIKRLLPLYGVLQVIVVSVQHFANYGGVAIEALLAGKTVEIWTPFWHLWYLLSYCIWAAVGWLWFHFCDKSDEKCKRRVSIAILILSILIGALAGYVPWLNRIFSGSRTVVFFPYFWAGVICKEKVFRRKYRLWGLASLGVATALLVLIGSDIPVTFLYHAEPYQVTMRSINVLQIAQATSLEEQVHILLENGFILRLVCYGLSSLLGFFLLTAIPSKRLPCTRAGADTMPGYLLHAPMVAVLREMNLPWGVCALLSAALLYIIYKILQWNSTVYGIIHK